MREKEGWEGDGMLAAGNPSSAYTEIPAVNQC